MNIRRSVAAMDKMIDGCSRCFSAQWWIFVFVLVLLATSVNVSTQGSSTNDIVGRTIPAAQNATIEVRMTGRGQPIILLSGTGADASSLDLFARALAAGGFQAVSVNP